MNKNKLTEDNLGAGIKVFWRNKEYVTGNRRHELVDLYHVFPRGNEFVRTVNVQSVSLIDMT